MSGNVWFFCLEMSGFFVWKCLVFLSGNVWKCLVFLSGNVWFFCLVFLSGNVWKCLVFLSGNSVFFVWKCLVFLSGNVWFFCLVFFVWKCLEMSGFFVWKCLVFCLEMSGFFVWKWMMFNRKNQRSSLHFSWLQVFNFRGLKWKKNTDLKIQRQRRALNFIEPTWPFKHPRGARTLHHWTHAHIWKKLEDQTISNFHFSPC